MPMQQDSSFDESKMEATDDFNIKTEADHGDQGFQGGQYGHHGQQDHNDDYDRPINIKDDGYV